MPTNASPIQVVVTGASGKMGRPIMATILEQPDMALVGGIAPSAAGQPIPGTELLFAASLGDWLAKGHTADVVVDVTHPKIGLENTLLAIQHGIATVVGTSGMNEAAREKITQALAKQPNIGCFIVPNFSLGAVLMMQFAKQASHYFQHSEIVEYHRNTKNDAPSGTAAQTALLMNHPDGNNPKVVDATELIPGSLGGKSANNIPIHSVRLPGMIAHQEVLFGGEGELLTVRHDTFSYDTFMPGVMRAIRHVPSITGLQIGLEHALDL